MRQQALPQPLLLQDTEAEVAHWLSQQAPDLASVVLLAALKTPYRPWYAVVGGLLFACLILCAVLGFVMVTLLVAVTLLALMISLHGEWRVQNYRRAWLREQLATCLAQGGRTIPLSTVVQGLGLLQPLPERAVEPLTQRLARATEDELTALTWSERYELRQRLKDLETPDVLRVCILLLLATLRDHLSLPYVQTLIDDPGNTARLREAAQEYLKAMAGHG